MAYEPSRASRKTTRILFPIVVTVIAGIVAPQAASALIGFLMFGNLIRECGVLDSLCPKRRRRCWPTSSRCFLGITIATEDAGGAVP